MAKTLVSSPGDWFLGSKFIRCLVAHLLPFLYIIRPDLFGTTSNGFFTGRFISSTRPGVPYTHPLLKDAFSQWLQEETETVFVVEEYAET